MGQVRASDFILFREPPWGGSLRCGLFFTRKISVKERMDMFVTSSDVATAVDFIALAETPGVRSILVRDVQEAKNQICNEDRAIRMSIF